MQPKPNMMICMTYQVLLLVQCTIILGVQSLTFKLWPWPLNAISSAITDKWRLVTWPVIANLLVKIYMKSLQCITPPLCPQNWSQISHLWCKSICDHTFANSKAKLMKVGYLHLRLALIPSLLSLKVEKNHTLTWVFVNSLDNWLTSNRSKEPQKGLKGDCVARRS